MQTTQDENEGTTGTMPTRTDSISQWGAANCVTFSACHSQTAQSRGIAVSPLEACVCLSKPAAPRRPGSTDACVCATAPRVEKKTYSKAARSADIRLCLEPDFNFVLFAARRDRANVGVSS